MATQERGSMSSRAWTRALAGLTAATSLMVVVLALRVRNLTEELRRLRFEANLPQVGDVAPPLRAALLDGDSVTLARPGAGRQQVWFVFNTTCPICRASLPGWTTAFERLAADSDLQVLGVSLDSAALTRGYVQANDLPFLVAMLDDPLEAALYRIPGVPVTIVLDDVGRIALVRPGAFEPPAADSLVTFLRSQPPRAEVVSGR